MTPTKEIKLALETIEKYRGLATFKIRSGSDSTVHLGDTKEHFVPAVMELINLSKETGARVVINNFSPLIGFEEPYRTAIESIEANTANADVHFSMHPFEYSVVPIVSFLPVWAQRGGAEEILKNLESPELTAKIIADLSGFSGDDIVIHDAPEFDYLVGKTLRAFGEDYGTAMPETLLGLMRLTKLRASLVHHNLSFGEFNHALASDRSFIASSGASFEDKRLRTRPQLFTDTIPTYLGKVLAEKPIALESAVYKITGLPAQRLGLKQRGFVREGYFADLVLFRDAHIETVFVNGVVAVRDGAYANVINGRTLIHANE
ncbi:hypothetical protein A2532_02425 [Candidatus Wolfebacteria bacterium RIFOXYD2_FULL_48_11]|nr:MAG: hypothetical protein A2532_02425 [Candidatus Wolfebacteria bacterium RIFOXYD2_FULL_48_11]